MENILKSLWFTPGLYGRWGLPAIFAGPPGTAKTAKVQRAAKACGFHLETVLASLRQPEDFLGLPIPARDEAAREEAIAWMREALPSAEPKLSEDGTSMTFVTVSYAPPRWAIKLALSGRGVAFFDEINTAPPAVQAALLRVTLEGVVGDLVLPNTIRMVGAMNRTDEAAGGWDLAPPLANRNGHFQVTEVTTDDWTNYMIGGGTDEVKVLNPANEEKRVTENWGPAYAREVGLVSGFLRGHRDMLLKMPPAGDPKASGAWPSPRTCEYVTRALAGATIHELGEMDRDQVTAAYVGDAFAIELAAYTRDADLPDTEALLDGQIKWKHNPARLDRTAAVFNSCATLIAQVDKKRKERAGALWSLLGTVVEDAADVTVPAAKKMVDLKLGLGIPAALPVLNKLFPVTEVVTKNR